MKFNDWFYIPRPCSQPAKRLFCFHPAGATALFFKGWTNFLPENIELVAIQLPGRFPRENEKPIQVMDELIACLAKAMLPLLDRPYLVFGHSMGALLAYGALKNLRKQAALQPLCFTVSACTAPHLLVTKKLYVDLKHIKSFDPLFKADLVLFDTVNYTPEPLLDVPLIICGGTKDLLVSQAGLLGWQELTNAKSNVHFYEDGHEYIVRHAPAVVDLLMPYMLSQSTAPSIVDKSSNYIIEPI